LAQGKYVVYGPFEDENDAYTEGLSKVGGYFEVVSLNTRDVQEASRIMRAKVLDDSDGDWSTAFKRFKHKL